MRIKVYSSHGDIGFVVCAENETDRAVLTMFTSYKYRGERDFHMHGHIYEGDHSAVTSFNFGWVDPPKKTIARKRRKK